MDLFKLALRVTAEGIEDAKKELADLEKAGKKVATASKEQQAEINRSIGLTRQLASVVDKSDQAAIGNLQTLVRAQKDWAVQVGASAEQFLKLQAVENKLDKTANAAERVAESGHRITESSHGSVEGVKKLGNSLEHLAVEMAGVNPVAGKLTAVLGEMALGGPIVLAITAGIAAIGVAYEKITAGSREAKKEVDDLIDSLNKQAKAQHDATVEGMKANLETLKSRQLERQDEVARAIGLQVGTFALFGNPNGPNKALEAATNAVKEQQEAIRKMNADTASEQQDLNIRLNNEWYQSEQDQIALEKQIESERKQASEEEKRRMDARIEQLSKAMLFDDLRAKASKQLTSLENSITKAIGTGNLTLARRIELEDRLAKIRTALAIKSSPLATEPTFSVTPGNDGSNPFTGFADTRFGGEGMKLVPEKAIKKLGELINESGQLAVKRLTDLQNTLVNAASTMAETVGDAIYNAFAAAFDGKGIGGSLKAFGKTILAGLGTVFKMVGEQVIIGAIMMKLIKQGLMKWNPALSLAAGIALVALGGAIGGMAGKAASRGFAQVSGFGGGGDGTDGLTRLKFVNRDGSIPDGLNRVQPIVHNWTVIGTADPKARREISEMVDAHSRRKG